MNRRQWSPQRVNKETGGYGSIAAAARLRKASRPRMLDMHYEPEEKSEELSDGARDVQH